MRTLQSVQSVLIPQPSNSDPAPPSSQSPSALNWHESSQSGGLTGGAGGAGGSIGGNGDDGGSGGTGAGDVGEGGGDGGESRHGCWHACSTDQQEGNAVREMEVGWRGGRKENHETHLWAVGPLPLILVRQTTGIILSVPSAAVTVAVGPRRAIGAGRVELSSTRRPSAHVRYIQVRQPGRGRGCPVDLPLVHRRRDDRSWHFSRDVEGVPMCDGHEKRWRTAPFRRRR